jgi:hypothetical protein
MKRKQFLIHRSKKVNDIFESKDYGLFKFDPINREINPAKVRRLIASMSKVGFLNQPIKINEDGVIIDGQHRFVAAQTLKLPVLYYIDRSSIDLYDNMSLTNDNTNPWCKQDHIHGLAKKGLSHYQHLIKFQTEFPEFTLTEQLMFMSNAFTNVSKDKFRKGKWEHKNMDVARKWATDLMSLKPYFKQGFNKSLFVRAIIDIMAKHPDFKFKEFFRKVQLRPGMIFLCGDVTGYKVMIETIYNYKRPASEKLNLRF